MENYTLLTQDEKDQIEIAVKRNLEYQMYTFETELVAENAKTNPSASRIEAIQANINELKLSIAAL
jgi:hypothetical protein